MSGIEAQPRAQQANLAALEADLPQHPRLSQGAVALHESIAEGSDALRDRAIEAAHLLDHRGVGGGHSLILVRELAGEGEIS